MLAHVLIKTREVRTEEHNRIRVRTIVRSSLFSNQFFATGAAAAAAVVGATIAIRGVRWAKEAVSERTETPGILGGQLDISKRYDQPK